MIECIKCFKEKDISNFHKNKLIKNGCRTICKDCVSRYGISIRDLESSYKQGINGQSSYYEKNKDIINMKSYETAKLNKVKRSAVQKLKYALKKGYIIKPNECSYCECCKHKIYGMHFDYKRPLDVEWVCTRCVGKKRRTIK